MRNDILFLERLESYESWYASEIFFYFGSVSSHEIYPLLSVERGHALDSFLIRVAHCYRQERACVCAFPRARDKKTCTFNGISIFSDREQGQKGLVLPRSSSFTSRRVTRSQFSFFARVSFLFSRSVFRRSPTPCRYANLRFEKLIARPSTCPCCVPPLPDLLKSPRGSIVGRYDAQCTYAPLL